MRFLIDECLSVQLVAVAGQTGHDDYHVAHVGRAGRKAVRYARDRDFILVANNASDFRRLYAAQPLHAGLVILLPVVGRDLQRRLFKAALDEFAATGEPINRVLEVDLDGEDVTLALHDLPSAAPQLRPLQRDPPALARADRRLPARFRRPRRTWCSTTAATRPRSCTTATPICWPGSAAPRRQPRPGSTGSTR